MRNDEISDLSDQCNIFKDQINELKNEKFLQKITDYFKYITKYFAKCNDLKVRSLYTIMIKEKAEALEEMGITRHVKIKDYEENSNFLKNLSEKEKHKSLIEFVSAYEINPQQFFLIQKSMMKRNAVCHVDIPDKISPEQFEDDILTELDILQEDDQQQDDEAISCCKKVLSAALLINKIDLNQLD